MNLQTLISASEHRLSQAQVSFGHGTSNAHDEAAWLVLWALGLPLDTEIDTRAVSPDQMQAAQALVEQRIQTRKPAAYLTREAWLQGLPFYVDERAIVPRSLIAEVLAEGQIDPWLNEQSRDVLDLCTGNGSLAVLAALAWPEVRVCASDLSQDALDVARINVDKHGLAPRIALVHSDGLAAFANQSFDLILCNPPYVCQSSMDALPPEYRAEPHLALAGGNDGMDFVRRLLQDAPAHLRPGGVLVLEIGHEVVHFEQAFPHLEPIWLSTSAGDEQVLLLTREALA
jgi:ribosomal protein L3 glutamine methyltransferase